MVPKEKDGAKAKDGTWEKGKQARWRLYRVAFTGVCLQVGAHRSFYGAEIAFAE